MQLSHLVEEINEDELVDSGVYDDTDNDDEDDTD